MIMGSRVRVPSGAPFSDLDFLNSFLKNCKSGFHDRGHC